MMNRRRRQADDKSNDITNNEEPSFSGSRPKRSSLLVSRGRFCQLRNVCSSAAAGTALLFWLHYSSSSIFSSIDRHDNTSIRVFLYEQPEISQKNGTESPSSTTAKKQGASVPVDFEDLLAGGWENEGCVPMYKWQLPTYGHSACNTIHELDIIDPNTEFSLISCGGSRCAYGVNDISEKGVQRVVIKIAKARSEDSYGKTLFLDAWRDTTVMERLTASPFVLDIHGGCGASQLVEYAKGGSLYDLIASARKNGGDGLSQVDKLKICHHVAAAVAAMHSIDSLDEASLVHNDLCCHQFINVDGIYKLNDFHLASLQLRNRTDGSACLQRAWRPNSRYMRLRAPEEFAGYLDKSKRIHRDKSDVWLMGNLLYYILTKRWLFQAKLNRQAIKLVMQGNRSDIRASILDSSDPATKAMIRGLEMAWTQEPDQRPTAMQIADFLDHELIKIHGSKDFDYRVNVPPLPPDYDYAEQELDWFKNYPKDPWP